MTLIHFSLFTGEKEAQTRIAFPESVLKSAPRPSSLSIRFKERVMFARTFSKKRRDFGNPIEYAKQNPHFTPPPLTNLTNLNLPLDIVLPTVDQEVQQAGKLVFHTVGDTGGINDGSVIQTAV